MAVELKLCPFCKADKAIFTKDGSFCYVGCLGCGARGPTSNLGQSDKVIEGWNKRDGK